MVLELDDENENVLILEMDFEFFEEVEVFFIVGIESWFVLIFCIFCVRVNKDCLSWCWFLFMILKFCFLFVFRVVIRILKCFFMFVFFVRVRFLVLLWSLRCLILFVLCVYIVLWWSLRVIVNKNGLLFILIVCCRLFLCWCCYCW